MNTQKLLQHTLKFKEKIQVYSFCGNTTIHQISLAKISSLDLPGAFGNEY